MLPRLPHVRLISRLAVFLLIALFGSALPVHAQNDGVVQGTVQDVQSAVLPGVALTLRNTDTGVVRSTVSEGDGQYRFAGLQPGTYAL